MGINKKKKALCNGVLSIVIILMFTILFSCNKDEQITPKFKIAFNFNDIDIEVDNLNSSKLKSKIPYGKLKYPMKIAVIAFKQNKYITHNEIDIIHKYKDTEEYKLHLFLPIGTYDLYAFAYTDNIEIIFKNGDIKLNDVTQYTTSKVYDFFKLNQHDSITVNSNTTKSLKLIRSCSYIHWNINELRISYDRMILESNIKNGFNFLTNQEYYQTIEYIKNGISKKSNLNYWLFTFCNTNSNIPCKQKFDFQQHFFGWWSWYSEIKFISKFEPNKIYGCDIPF